MNQAFDYNGVVVAQSAPKKVLRTVKKTIHIDSADRDTTKYYTNGDFWVYLPRNYQHIVSIRLKDAQFPPVVSYPSTSTAATLINASTPATGYVTYTVTSTNGINVGNTIVIAGNATAGYNGTFIVQSIPSTTTLVLKNATTGAGVFTSGTATIVSPGAATHPYINGLNVTPSGNPTQYASDTLITTPTYYFLLGLEGLNKVDETSVGANRSTFSDSFFAKIPATTTTYGATSFIAYNDHSTLENIATYSPPIENLDRLRVTVRTHAQQDKNGFLYWTTDGGVATASNTGGAANFNLTLEVEYMENAFTDFSTFETRLAQRS
jgi:hypothetical protein